MCKYFMSWVDVQKEVFEKTKGLMDVETSEEVWWTVCDVLRRELLLELGRVVKEECK